MTRQAAAYTPNVGNNFLTDIMWRHRNTFAIGGLENVGYASNQDILIVLSSQGQGIFDCLTGEKIARQNDEINWWDNFNQRTNSILGFGRLMNIEIQTSGLYGVDILPKTTADGWTLIASDPEPGEIPFEKSLVRKIYLISPDKQQKRVIGKDGACELRAFGFSETGNSLIIALSCELTIYSRTEIPGLTTLNIDSRLSDE